MATLQARMHALFNAITDPVVLTDPQKDKNMVYVCEQATARHVKTFLPNVPLLNPEEPDVTKQLIDLAALTVNERCAITLDRCRVMFQTIGRQQRVAAKKAADEASTPAEEAAADAETGLGGA